MSSFPPNNSHHSRLIKINKKCMKKCKINSYFPINIEPGKGFMGNVQRIPITMVGSWSSVMYLDFLLQMTDKSRRYLIDNKEIPSVQMLHESSIIHWSLMKPTRSINSPSPAEITLFQLNVCQIFMHANCKYLNWIFSPANTFSPISLSSPLKVLRL